MRITFLIVGITGTLVACAWDGVDRIVLRWFESELAGHPTWLRWAWAIVLPMVPGLINCCWKAGRDALVREALFVCGCVMLLGRDLLNFSWPSSGTEPWLIVTVACVGRIAGQAACFFCDDASARRNALIVATFLLVATGFFGERFGSSDRWIGILEEPNRYGTLAGCGLVMAVISIHAHSGPRKNRVEMGLVVVAAVAFLCALIGSASRGAIVAVVVTTIPVMLNATRSEGVATKLQSRAFIVTGVVVVVLAAVSIVHGSSRTVSLVTLGDLSLLHRLHAWHGAGEIIKVAPLHGVGWGNVVAVYEGLWKPDFVPNGLALKTNDWLTIAAASGLVAMLGIFGAISGVRLRSDKSGVSILSCGLAVLVLGAAFSAMLTHAESGVYCWLVSELAFREEVS